MDCPFCEIDKERTRVVKRGKHVLVILSDPRLVDGHLLVMPTRHVERLAELSAEERGELLNTVVKFQEKILSKFAAGCDIRSNYRPFIKQNDLKVNHLHFHLLPRELEDDLYQRCQKFEKEIFKRLTKEELEKFYKLFSK